MISKKPQDLQLSRFPLFEMTKLSNFTLSLPEGEL